MTELTIYTQHHSSYLGFLQFVYTSHTMNLTIILTMLSVFGVTDPSPISISETVQEYTTASSTYHYLLWFCFRILYIDWDVIIICIHGAPLTNKNTKILTSTDYGPTP